MTKFAAAYIRVSTDNQIDFSLNAQIKALKDYAKRNDMIILNEHIYADDEIFEKYAEKLKDSKILYCQWIEESFLYVFLKIKHN